MDIWLLIPRMAHNTLKPMTTKFKKWLWVSRHYWSTAAWVIPCDYLKSCWAMRGELWNKRTNVHYDDVIMTTIASQITILTIVYSTVYSDADQRKHQSSASLAFVWGIHRDRWIPRTKGQLRGKCFHLMTSSWVHTVPQLDRWDG